MSGRAATTLINLGLSIVVWLDAWRCEIDLVGIGVVYFRIFVFFDLYAFTQTILCCLFKIAEINKNRVKFNQRQMVAPL